MAALGALTPYTPREADPGLVPIDTYTIIRGRYRGPIALLPDSQTEALFVKPLTNYTVRQLRVLYRQLWPSKGQRFPQ